MKWTEKRMLADRYELTAPLARGGMGQVMVGRDTRLDREIAVKFLRFPDGEQDPDMVRRFVRESRITAGLQHPGVPAVFDGGSEDGHHYLVMQRVRGIGLHDLISEQERLSVGWSACIAAQVCSVLSAAHGASLVHRDLKPANMMLEREGTVKVLDFGLAVALDRADMSQITRTGHTPGTPAYMAPEQLLAGSSTPLSDLYALGCVLHEMLTGQRVFTASTSFALASKQVNDAPTGVRRLRPDVPAELAEVVSALLEKRPEDRPADADQVYARLIGFATGLEPVPGELNPPEQSSPHRMYGAAVAKVFGAGAPAEADEPRPAAPDPAPEHAAARPPEDTVDAVPLSRVEVKRARDEAADLGSSARYQQAAQTLREAVTSATASFGATDPDTVRLRMDWANVLFEGGNFRGAAPVYAELVADLEGLEGDENQSLVFRCRLQNATCHALSGQTSAALSILSELLDDEVDVYGHDDHRPLELRRQIGLLELAAGRREDAEPTLRDLREDLVRLHGPKHPAVAQLDDLLTGSLTQR
ncbi:serine/threonine protein kinase [Nocardiopsis exhalans]|uniref:Serine/threonine protein kinase n=1 Tax=Nocardiopsis exhalans TaxID=163604 RepID=A0ABY5D1T4_9ACTN|nr:serine/threonine-protein kinase [Nocardiopsis exhalans]USY17478.1 serine/threonine protein kinase [Nocardiopsis exhalans]